MRTWQVPVVVVALALAGCGSDSSTSEPRITTLATAPGATDAPGSSEATSTTIPAPVYVLQSGDSPSKVAAQFGLMLEDLAAYNAGWPAYQRFVAGSVIWVGSPPTSLPPTSSVPHTPTAGVVKMSFTGRMVSDDGVTGDGDYAAMLSAVAPLVADTDMAACHLDGGELALLGTLSASGFDLCTSADGPAVPLADQALLANGFEVNGVQVAVLSYDGDADPADILDEVALVRAAGAELVVVIIDWGDVRTVEPSDAQRELVRTILGDLTVDLVIGQSPVLQPVEQVDGVWVAWGLGTTLGSDPADGGWPTQSEDAAILRVRFQRGFDGSISGDTPSLVATWCDRDDGHVVHPTADMGDASLAPDVRVALLRSDERSQRTLGELLAA